MVEAVSRGTRTRNAPRIIRAGLTIVGRFDFTVPDYRLALTSRRGGDLHCSQANDFFVRYCADWRRMPESVG